MLFLSDSLPASLPDDLADWPVEHYLPHASFRAIALLGTDTSSAAYSFLLQNEDNAGA